MHTLQHTYTGVLLLYSYHAESFTSLAITRNESLQSLQELTDYSMPNVMNIHV